MCSLVTVSNMMRFLTNIDKIFGKVFTKIFCPLIAINKVVLKWDNKFPVHTRSSQSYFTLCSSRSFYQACDWYFRLTFTSFKSIPLNGLFRGWKLAGLQKTHWLPISRKVRHFDIIWPLQFARRKPFLDFRGSFKYVILKKLIWFQSAQ